MEPYAGVAGPRPATGAVESAAPWPWLLSAPTFTELVERRAALTPEAPMLIDEHGTTVRCREFRTRVERVAAALAGQGIRPGTRVSWQLPTRISTFLIMAALRRLGAVQAPVIPLYREREVAVAVSTSEADVLLVPGIWQGFDYTAMAHEMPLVGSRRPRVLAVGHDAPESENVGALPTVPRDPDEVAWIYFTSGSAGAPKGAMHTDNTLLVTGTGFAGNGRLGAREGEVAGMGFPVAHVGGVQYVIAAMAAGFPIVLLETFVPHRALEVFRAHGVTTTGGAPPFYSALLGLAREGGSGAVLPTLRTLKGGGAPCPASLFYAVRDELGAVLAHDYGMTEVPMVAVACPDDPAEILAETDGRVLPSNTVRIVDADGAACPTGETGEIQVAGDGVCRGYTDERETAAAFTDDGWFRTGDVGRLYPTGHIEVVGRLKDVIIRKGENIVPQEIEQLLADHPAVADVAVIGLPDPVRGERVCAVVAPADGHEPLDLAGIGAWLLDAGLMRQKLPEQLEQVEELPRTGLAKVAKAQLRKRLSGDPGS